MEYIEKYEMIKNLGNLLTHLSYSKTIFFQEVDKKHDEMDLSLYGKIFKKILKYMILMKI